MLANHMKTHLHYYRCKTCPFRTKTAADLKVHADEDCHEVQRVQDCKTDPAVRSRQRTKYDTGTPFDERQPKKKRKSNVVSRRCFSFGEEVSLKQDLSPSSIPPIGDNLIGVSCHVSSARSASSQLTLSNMEQIPVFPYGSTLTTDCRSSDIYFSKSLDHKFSRLPSAAGCSSEDPLSQVDRANADNFRCSLCSFEAVSGNELVLHTLKIHRLTAKKSFDPVLSVSSYLFRLEDHSEDTPDQCVTGRSMFSQNLLNAILPNDIDAFSPSSGYEHAVDIDRSAKVSRSQLRSQSSSNKLPMSIECRTSEPVTKTGATIEAERKTSKRINCTVTDQASDHQQNTRNDLSSVLRKDYDSNNSAVAPLDLSLSHTLPKVDAVSCGRGNQSDSELVVLTVQSRRKGRTRKLDLSAIDNRETETMKLNVALIEPVHESVADSDMSEHEKTVVKNSLAKNSPLNEALLLYSIEESKDSIFVNREPNETRDYSSSSLKNQLPLVSVSPNSLLFESEENQNSDSSRVSEISNNLPPSYKINPIFTESRTSKDYPQSKTKASDGHESHERWKYKCRHCLMSFRDSLMHQLHMGFHNFENPFRCNYCGKDNENHLNFYQHLGEVAHPNLQS